MRRERASNSIASAIQTLRSRSGLSYERLAQELGVSLMTLHRWKSGRGQPTDANLAKLYVSAFRYAPTVGSRFLQAMTEEFRAAWIETRDMPL